jgi:hypothetical protein
MQTVAVSLNHRARALALTLVVALAGALLIVAGARRASAAANTYYVSTSGSDANPGTVASPWATVKKGLTALHAGDTLLVRGGTYDERIQSPSIQSGTASAPITVAAYPGERPIVKGLLWITGATDWTFDGINVTWDPATDQPSEHMVKFTNGVGWTFKDAEVWGAHSYGDFLVASTMSGQPADWAISNNCIHDNYGAQDHINGDHLIYVNSHDTPGGVIERNLMFDASNGEGVKLGSADVPEEGPANVVVRYNTIYYTGQSVLVAWSAQRNEIYGNLLDYVNVNGQNPAYGNIRGYQLTGSGNTAHDNLGYKAKSFLLNDVGYVGVADAGGNDFPTDPQFDSTASCAGFHPQNAKAQSFGVYAGQGPPPSGIDFRASSSAKVDSATSLVMTRPSGVKAKDVMLASVSWRGNRRVTAPSGWTLVRSDVTGTTLTESTYYRVAGASEPSTYRWTFSKVAAAAGGIVAYSGVNTSSPVMASSGQISSTSSTSIVAPQVTTTVGGGMLVGLFGIAVNTSVAPPASLGEVMDLSVTSSRHQVAFEYADALQAKAGPTGTKVAVAANAASNIGQLVVLKPA